MADESKTVASTVELAVQVNGKLKGTISMPTDSEEKAVVDAALAVEKVEGHRRDADHQDHPGEEPAGEPDRQAREIRLRPAVRTSVFAGGNNLGADGLCLSGCIPMREPR